MQPRLIAQAAVDAFNAAHGGRGGIAHVARRIGYARPSLSLYLADRYPAGSLARIEAAILRALCGRVTCPHLGRELSAAECREYACRPMPLSDPWALKHWRACRTCRHNPATEESDAV